MDPLLLQQQLKNNNEDLREFFNDLQSWGQEMDRKEQERKPQKRHTHKEVSSKLQEIKEQTFVEADKTTKQEMFDNKKTGKKKCMTYSDWEKFDADKECEKVDEDSESSSESLMEDLKDQATIEKEQGNKFVKAGEWNEAIRSYTNAIKYYAYDPIFYANRALCFLKTKQMEKAEQDCNISLKLDNTYVKAYQRRSVAREALNKLEEAKLDLLRVLQLEPKNSESKRKLDELVQKINGLATQMPVSKFRQSRQNSMGSSQGITNKLSHNVIQSTSTNIDSNKTKCIWPSGEVDNIIKATEKSPHMRSKKPLKRIPIEEINSAIPNTNSKEGENLTKYSFNTTEIKIVEHKNTEISSREQIPVKPEEPANIVQLSAPKTSVQFHAMWKQLKGQNHQRGKYLRLVDPKNIPDLFKDSLESDVFSEILLVLAEHLAEETDETYQYLLNLSKMKRFSALAMFLSLNDKNSLWKMFNHMKEYEGRSKEEIDNLISKYEL